MHCTMANLTMSTLLFLMIFIQGITCLEWSQQGLQAGEHVTLCRGSVLILDWQIRNTTGASIVAVNWFFHGRSDQLVAYWSHGFFVPTPSYHGRVEQLNKAGLRVFGLTAGNDGLYSVEINAVDDKGLPVTLNRNATVQIVDGLQTTDGQLHALQSPLAEVDVTTGQSHVFLTCGKFIYINRPAFDLIWTTPSGQQLPSTSFKDGYFWLRLESPVKGGDYTCAVPTTAAQQACNHGQPDNATISVDAVEARFALLEAQVIGLRNTNSRLEANVSGLEAEVMGLQDTNSKLEANVSGLEDNVLRLEAKVTGLQKTNSHLEENVSGLEDSVLPLEAKVLGLQATSSLLLANVSSLEAEKSLLKSQVSGLEANVSSLQVDNAAIKQQLTAQSNVTSGDDAIATEKRFAALEAQNATTSHELSVIKEENSAFQQTLSVQNKTIHLAVSSLKIQTSDIEHRLSEHKIQLQSLAARGNQVALTVENVTSSLQNILMDAKQPSASFMATYIKNQQPAQNEALVFTDVLLNQGQGYDASTGVFTSPRSGVYIFLATLNGYGVHAGEQSAYVQLNKDKVDMVQLHVLTEADRDNDLDSTSLQAVVHVLAGEKVWLSAMGNDNRFFCCGVNSFSGVLVAKDP